MDVRQNNSLKQPTLAADMAPLLKSKDSNKAINLKNLKTDLSNSLKNNKDKIQHIALLSLQKSIDKAVRPVKLNNIKKG